MNDTIQSKCLYCGRKVELPKLEGFMYSVWPVHHENPEECYLSMHQLQEDVPVKGRLGTT